MKTSFTSPATVLVATLLLFAGTARATQQTFLIKDGSTNTGWAVVYDDTQVSSLVFTGNTTGRLQGLLTLTKTFNNVNPISMDFVELAPAAADSFGLRVDFNETVINQSGTNWAAFKMDIIDTNAFYDSGSTDHPGFAHFHPRDFTAPPFSTINPSNNFPGVSNLFLSGGTFLNGTTNAWTANALHQYEVQSLQRPFTLVETPIAVPEPSTLLLAFAGILGFAIFRRRRS